MLFHLKESPWDKSLKCERGLRLASRWKTIILGTYNASFVCNGRVRIGALLGRTEYFRSDIAWALVSLKILLTNTKASPLYQPAQPPVVQLLANGTPWRREMKEVECAIRNAESLVAGHLRSKVSSTGFGHRYTDRKKNNIYNSIMQLYC